MARIFLLIFLIFILSRVPAGAQQDIQWLTWEEAQVKSKKEKRKIFVDIYTEWCGWCKKMDKTTFSNEAIVEHLNDNYYAIRLDAENKKEIFYQGKKFGFSRHGNRGYHELATTLLHGKMSFPSLAFLDEDFNLIQAIPGYQDEIFFLMIASYFSENAHKKIPWNKYMEDFEKRNSPNKKR